MTGALWRALAILAIAVPASLPAQDLPNEGELVLEEYSGVLPDGEFAFAMRVERVDDPFFDALGLTPGTVITQVRIDRPGRLTRGSQSPGQVPGLLAEIQRGDLVRIDVVRPGASKRETISYRVPTEAEIAATERKERMARQAEEAARSHAAGDPFGSSYWGARLRLIALGAFDLARAVHEQDASIAPDIIRSIVGDRAEGIVGLIEGFARLEARTAPLAGLITAYGITRSVVLGDCDEPEVRVTQVSRTWVEYRNGLGHYMGSSAARTQKTTVGIARKFVPMLSRSQNIDVSALASMNVEAILARMNCDDPWRQRLEDNLVAFFNHVPAVHRGRP